MMASNIRPAVILLSQRRIVLKYPRVDSVKRWPLTVALAAGTVFAGWHLASLAREGPQRKDPTAWGTDHVGQPVPEFITGDECLFCHRDIGPSWPDNGHLRTVRRADANSPALKLLHEHPATKDLAAQVQYLLGTDQQIRFLKRSPEYGKLELLSTTYQPQEDAESQLQHDVQPRWDPAMFADRCAGCHSTGVDAKTKSFSSLSLDCYTCHGNVVLEHTKDPSKVLLSATNREPRQVVSICGQCHLRGGESRSTRRPYPNNFVAGDNLLRDFDVAWPDDDTKDLAAVDRHIFANARDVLLLEKSELTCLSCHDVHEQSTEKHLDLPRTAICRTCHVAGKSRPLTELHRSHSKVCGY